MIGGNQPHPSPACVRRQPDEFPRAPELLGSLRDAIERMIGRSVEYHAYGGFVRACITGEDFTDVDVAAASKSDRAALQPLASRLLDVIDASGRPVKVRLDVARRVVASPAALIARIELVMARLAFSTTDGCFHMDPDCLEAIATRTLSLRPVSGPFTSPARAIRRTMKYASRGYRLPMEALLWTIEEYRRTPAAVRWGDYGLRTILGKEPKQTPRS